LNHRFLQIKLVVFWDGQVDENEFKVTCDPLKHFFLDFTKASVWALQKEGNVF